ncbi:MAG: alpha-hydroxy acid oxidase [Thermoplasmata archaeon]
MTTDAPPGGFLTLGDLEELAAARLPDDVWAMVQGAAGEEWTLRANRDAFHRQTLRPRVLTGVATLDLRTRILSEPASAPLFIAPMAYQGLLHPDAELATARAARDANVPTVVSTLSTRSLEEISAAAPEGDRWFQLYLQPEFASSVRLVERAERAGYRALVLTVDTPVLANRDRQMRGGLAYDTPVPIGNGADILSPSRTPVPEGDHYALRAEASATWDILDRLRSVTRLPLVVKGILTPEDARLALDHGVRGIIVSNHGARQLDGAPAALDALPEVVRAVGDRAEVYYDSGVRRGSDVVMALAMGARAVGIGRPVLWALAVGGEAGVTRLLSLLKVDLATVMAVTGRTTIASLDRSVLGSPRW